MDQHSKLKTKGGCIIAYLNNHKMMELRMRSPLVLNRSYIHLDKLHYQLCTYQLIYKQKQ